MIADFSLRHLAAEKIGEEGSKNDGCRQASEDNSDAHPRRCEGAERLHGDGAQHFLRGDIGQDGGILPSEEDKGEINDGQYPGSYKSRLVEVFEDCFFSASGI